MSLLVTHGKLSAIYSFEYPPLLQIHCFSTAHGAQIEMICSRFREMIVLEKLAKEPIGPANCYTACVLQQAVRTFSDWRSPQSTYSFSATPDIAAENVECLRVEFFIRKHNQPPFS
jgi:hypothetical protein